MILITTDFKGTGWQSEETCYLCQNTDQQRAVVNTVMNFQVAFHFSNGATAPGGPGPPHYRGFTITLRHTPHSVRLLWTGDQPDAETSTWQHTTLTRNTSMPQAGFEPAIPASQRPQIHASVVTGIGTGMKRYEITDMKFLDLFCDYSIPKREAPRSQNMNAW
jgi:hypothetical protein